MEIKIFRDLETLDAAVKAKIQREQRTNSRPLDVDDDSDLIHLYNLPLIKKRAIHQLQGIASAIIYDGKIDGKEIEQLVSWLNANKFVENDWPVCRLREIMVEILADGIITDDEEKELISFLSDIEVNPEGPQVVCQIFTPNPKIKFNGKTFLFTGTLKFGARKKAEGAVIKRGGECAKGSYKPLIDYLVVGDLGSDAWKYSKFGTKIEACMIAQKEKKAKTSIVQERDFISAVVSHPCEQ